VCAHIDGSKAFGSSFGRGELVNRAMDMSLSMRQRSMILPPQTALDGDQPMAGTVAGDEQSSASPVVVTADERRLGAGP
jgi:hypothetical protein